MMRLTLTLALLASLLPAAVASANARVAPAAAPGSAWADDEYHPRPGHWKPYVLSPSSRSVAPARVLEADARDGAIVGDPSSALREDGRSVRLTSMGSRTGSPLLMLDFGQEVAGKIRVHVTGASDPRPRLHACFSESRRYMAFGSRNDGQAALAPGCDTANIWIGFPGTPYTEDRDSHILDIDGGVDSQRRGGFRYLTLFLDGPGSLDLDAVSLDFTPAGGQGPDLSRYAGTFLSSDDGLNKAWYAGAYTVQLNTDSPASAKSWPYEAGERDHADNPVPHADPGADVIYDGGKRDRIVWQGDLAVQQPVALLSTADRAAVDNSLSSLAAQQEPDGYMPAASLVGPHNFGEKRTYGEYVTWFVHNMAEHWRFTGDRAYLERWWPAMERAVAWLEGERNRDARGLISFEASGSCGHYGYRNCGHETYVNALYKRNLDQLAELAHALGQDADADRYGARADAVAAAINAELWDEQAGAYRLSRELPDAHPQDANAAAILTGVAGPQRATRALAFLRSHTWARYGSLTVDPAETNPSLTPFYAPLPTGFEIEARMAGTADPRGLETARGLDLVRRYVGFQLARDPQSTLWEHVKPDGTPNLSAFSSLAHGWGAGPTESLTTRVLGVNPTAPGFKRFDVMPHPGDLEWAEGRVPTPHGAVRAEWRREGDERFRLELDVPDGTVARAAVPTFGRDVEVTVDGRRTNARKDGDRIVIDGLRRGKHRISTRATDRAPATAVEATVIPERVDGAQGETVALRLAISGTARHRLAGTVKVAAPEGWTVSPREPAFDLPSDGSPAGQELRVYVVVPDDARGGSYPVRFTVVTRDGARATATGTVRLSSARRLYGFEQDTEGWQPGALVSSVARVTSFANGAGRPFEGTGALEATVPPTPASSLKSVQVTPSTRST